MTDCCDLAMESQTCGCLDPRCWGCHDSQHQPGKSGRCARCGDQAMTTGLCVAAEKGVRCA